jgi:hypothetical protein
MLKLERNMIERILEGKATIEFQVEAFKVLGENLSKIESAIKEGKEIAAKIDTKVIESELNKETKSIKITATKTEEVKPKIKSKPVVTEEAKTKKELNVKKATQEIKQEVKRQIKHNNKMVKCGKNEGNDEIVYIEKIKDDLHTWRGQIRLQNVVYNFHWSNELSLPVVYNVPELSFVLKANDMIKEKVGNNECEKYDQLFTSKSELGNYGGRYYYDDLEKGSFVYMTPWFGVKKDEPKVWFKGYTMDHAFVVFSDKRIYYRNVNYLFAKRPWETTVSKGYDTKEVRRSACKLMKLVIEQFNNCVDNDKNKEIDTTTTKDAAITKTDLVDNKNNNVVSQDVEYIDKNKKISIEDIDAGKRVKEDVEAQKAMLDNMDVSALF